LHESFAAFPVTEECFGEPPVCHHLERPEVSNGGCDHCVPARALDGIRIVEQHAAVPKCRGRLLDSNRKVMCLADCRFEMIARLFSQARSMCGDTSRQSWTFDRKIDHEHLAGLDPCLGRRVEGAAGFTVSKDR